MAAVDFDETAFWDDELTPEKAEAYTKRKESAAATGPSGTDRLGAAYRESVSGSEKGFASGGIPGAIIGGVLGAIQGGASAKKGDASGFKTFAGINSGPMAAVAQDAWKKRQAAAAANRFGEGYAGTPDAQMPGGTQSEMGDFELGSEWA